MSRNKDSLGERQLEALIRRALKREEARRREETAPEGGFEPTRRQKQRAYKLYAEKLRAEREETDYAQKRPVSGLFRLTAALAVTAALALLTALCLPTIKTLLNGGREDTTADAAFGVATAQPVDGAPGEQGGDVQEEEETPEEGEGSDGKQHTRPSPKIVSVTGKPASSTPTVTPAATPAITPTVTPTVAPTATPTVTPTATPTVTPTATPTVTPTATPTVTPTATPTPTPAATPTAAPTATPTATPTPAPFFLIENRQYFTLIELYLRQGNYATINNRIYQRYVTEGEKAVVYLRDEDLSREGMFQISASFRGHMWTKPQYATLYSNWPDVDLSELTGRKLVIYEDENKKPACRIEELTDEERAQYAVPAAKPTASPTPPVDGTIPENCFRLRYTATNGYYSLAELYLWQDGYASGTNRLSAFLSYGSETFIALTQEDLERGGTFTVRACFVRKNNYRGGHPDIPATSISDTYSIELEALIGRTLVIKNGKDSDSVIFEIE
ncbi:MAG: hypothetical protein II875_00170 [Clostridia bacterium]|nr:hypothetical protein [Clostridia bacterium]